MEKLQILIQKLGIARRKAAEVIQNGGVTVNGVVIKEPWFIPQESDVIEFNGKKNTALDILKNDRKVYYLLHKPVGMICSMNDEKGRMDIKQYISDKIPENVYYVGRLDSESSGLILLTNDGEFADILQHPRYKISKVYKVLAEGHISFENLDKLREGVLIEEGTYKTQPAKIEQIKMKGPDMQFLMTITEGKKRQIREMCKTVGHKVLKLKRVKFGPWSVEEVPLPGDIKKLDAREIAKLKLHLMKMINEGETEIKSEQNKYQKPQNTGTFRKDDNRPSYRKDDDSRKTYKKDDNKPSYKKDDDSRKTYKKDDNRPSYKKDDDSRKTYKKDDNRPSYKKDDDSKKNYKKDDNKPSYRKDDDSKKNYKKDDNKKSYKKDDNKKSYKKDKPSKPANKSDKKPENNKKWYDKPNPKKKHRG